MSSTVPGADANEMRRRLVAQFMAKSAEASAEEHRQAMLNARAVAEEHRQKLAILVAAQGQRARQARARGCGTLAAAATGSPAKSAAELRFLRAIAEAEEEEGRQAAKAALWARPSADIRFAVAVKQARLTAAIRS